MASRAGGNSNGDAGGKKRVLEWDLNDWSSGGTLFRPRPLLAADPSSFVQLADGSGPSDGSTSPSDELDFEASGVPSGQIDKRRRAGSTVGKGEHNDRTNVRVAGYENEDVNGHGDANGSSENGNGTGAGDAATRPTCQVEGCDADLMDPNVAKDYHRKHKVCEMHSKAKIATVRNTVQRFCQQCSRFHLLDEFDNDKKSCRRRLASHNGRRRKNYLNGNSNANLLSDEQTIGVALLKLLKVLASAESSNSSSEPHNDANLIPQLLKTLSAFAGSSILRQNTGVAQVSHHNGTAVGTSKAVYDLPPSGYGLQDSSTRHLTRAYEEAHTVDCQELPARNLPSPAGAVVSLQPPTVTITGQSKGLLELATSVSKDGAYSNTQDVIVADHSLLHVSTDKSRMWNFDLNDTYNDQDSAQDCMASEGAVLVEPLTRPYGINLSSRPQMNDKLDHFSKHPFSFGGENESRTGKIVFKLFGKDRHDVPPNMRTQIYNWLSHCPTDMESFIRPGCIIVTVYLQLLDSLWLQLEENTTNWMQKLITIATNDDAKFWCTGWMYARFQSSFAFLNDGLLEYLTESYYDPLLRLLIYTTFVIVITVFLFVRWAGEVILEVPYEPRTQEHHILCVTPIAASYSSVANFSVRCSGVVRSSSVLLCAFNGNYLVQEKIEVLSEEADCENVLQRIEFSCSLPDVSGRGFIEVEAYDHSSAFFPFIVAEDNICSEIRMLERDINITPSAIISNAENFINCRNQALRFIDELGWLLTRNILERELLESPNLFTVSRFRWIMSFSIDKEFPAVVRKLLDILFQGRIEIDVSSPYEFARGENLLESAIQRRSKLLVEALLRYTARITPNTTAASCFLFTPDMTGPSGYTPLHLAASLDDADCVVDALINDPQQLGIKAWKNARDKDGLTPDDYAIRRHRESYRILVQQKMDMAQKKDVHIDMPACPQDVNLGETESTAGQSDHSAATFHVEWHMWRSPNAFCKKCQLMLDCRAPSKRGILGSYGVLPLILIAAVCVAVGLFMTSPPRVAFCHHPFLWDSLGRGPN